MRTLVVAIAIAMSLAAVLLSHADAGPCGLSCQDPDTKGIYPVGMSWTSNNTCMEYSCVQRPSEGNATKETDIQTQQCPQFKLMAGCILTPEDMTKTYPHCCPQPVCPPHL